MHRLSFLIAMGLVALLLASACGGGEESAVTGKIAFVSTRDDLRGEIYVMGSDGSDPARLTSLPGFDRAPAWSPDGMRIAFVRDDDIWVMNSDGGDQIRLTQSGGFGPTWSPDGTQLAFFRNDRLLVIDAEGSDGTETTIVPDGATWPAWSPDGSLIAFQLFSDGRYELHSIAVDGSGLTQLTDNLGVEFIGPPAWSPDGSHIAFSITGRNRDPPGDINYEIHVMRSDGVAPTRLTNSPAIEKWPSWSPDGLRIAFDRGGDIWVMDADGSNPTNLTNSPNINDSEPVWSPVP